MYTRRYYPNYYAPGYYNSYNNFYGNSYRDYLADYYPYRYANRSDRRYYGPRRSRRSYPWYYDYEFERRRRRNTTDDVRDEEEEAEEEEEEEEPVTEEINKRLHVERIALNVRKNALFHHTDKYECTMKEENQILVVRRGQAFRISIYLDRAFNAAQHRISFRFFIGENPNPAKHTEARVVMIENTNAKRNDPKKWFVKLKENVEESKSVLLEITPPSNCIVGPWMMEVETESKIREDGDTLKLIYKHDKDFFVLFNPYSQEDQVHMPASDLLKEYLDNELGVIFVGNAWEIGGRPWNFGQFQGYDYDGSILKICFHILRKAYNNKINIDMASPKFVSRAISQMVNAPGDGGVLVGKWADKEEEYSDGEVPWYWTGSSDILKEYDRAKMPVKYGQCWVYAGLTTTVCRALGIPCRCVTNFQSAHDTNASTTHDKYYRFNEAELDFEIIEGSHNADSIWNFHVWNEGWMKRLDIKAGDCDGWQVIDATPQETSEGMFRCGPCPVTAIKKGDIDKPYDGNFIFGEVNADDIMWIYDEMTEELYINEVDQHGIGQKISTKFPDGKPYSESNIRFEDRDAYRVYVEKFREDITHTYKYTEGSQEERMAVQNALEIAGRESNNYLSYIGRNRDVYFTGDEKQEVAINIITKDGFMAGEDFEFTVKINNKNKTESKQIRQLLITVDSTSYTGRKVENITKQKWDYFDLNRDEEKAFDIKVGKEEYIGKMTEYFSMEIHVSALAIRMVDDLSYVDFIRKSRPYRLRRPIVDIQVKENIKEGRPFRATLSFENPMQDALTKCRMHIAGNGIKDISKGEENVPPGSIFKEDYMLEAQRPGEINIIASFVCRELPDITGSITVNAI